MSSNQTQKDTNKSKYLYISAAHLFSSIFASAVTYPLDLSKTRLQVSGGLDPNNKIYQGSLDVLRKVSETEKRKNIFRGGIPSALATAVSWAIFMPIYKFALEKNSIYLENQVSRSFLSATEAGLGTFLITNPLWVVKARMQVQLMSNPNKGNTKIYRNLIDGWKTIWRAEGLKGMYSGFSTSMILSLQSGLMFSVLDYPIQLNNIQTENTSQLSQFFLNLAQAGLARLIGTTVFHPVSVVRTRLFMESSFFPPGSSPGTSSRLTTTVKKIWNSEGPSGFYKGFMVQIVRGGLSWAITVATARSLLSFV